MSRLGAFVRKDFLVVVSYKSWFFFQIYGIATSLATLYFLSRLFADKPPAFIERYGSHDYFAFAVFGMALLDFMWVALGSFSTKLRDLQLLGTLEAMLATPVSAEMVILSSSAYAFGWATMRMILYLSTAQLLLGGLISQANWLSALLVYALTLCAFAGLGLLSAGLTLLLKISNPIAGLFGGVFFLFGGVLYPVEVLPGGLGAFAAYLPMTLATTGLRRAFLAGASPAELSLELFGLSLYALALLPAALLFLRWSVRFLRREGTIALH